MAPSGKFWMAMPSESASAPAAEIWAVQRHGEDHHGRPLQLRARALGLTGVAVQVGDDAVEQQQEGHADPEADGGGQERKTAERGRLINGRDEQAPDGGRDHHTGGKAGQGALQPVAERFAKEEHAGRAERGAEKRDEDPIECCHRRLLLWLVYTNHMVA